MIVYLDGSALVKLYVEEDGSGAVRRWCGEGEALATSPVAYVEVLSALARRRREGALADDGARDAVTRLGSDWPSFVRIAMDERAAGAIAERHSLRALAVVHVAAAVTLAHLGADVTVTFVTYDTRQAVAAAAEGLTVVP